MPLKWFVLLGMMFPLISGCTQPDYSLYDSESVRKQLSDLDRGRYVIEIMGCNDCHTPDYLVKRSNVPEKDWLIGSNLGFRGPNGTAYPTNLRLLVNNMSEEDWLVLAKQMRNGSAMADVMLPDTLEQDLLAIYRFIKYLGPQGVPAPARLPSGETPTTPYIVYPVPH